MEHMGYEINKNINQLFVDQGVFSCKKSKMSSVPPWGLSSGRPFIPSFSSRNRWGETIPNERSMI